jgi:hypothetical protein
VTIAATAAATERRAFSNAAVVLAVATLGVAAAAARLLAVAQSPILHGPTGTEGTLVRGTVPIEGVRATG